MQSGHILWVGINFLIFDIRMGGGEGTWGYSPDYVQKVLMINKLFWDRLLHQCKFWKQWKDVGSYRVIYRPTMAHNYNANLPRD